MPIPSCFPRLATSILAASALAAVGANPPGAAAQSGTFTGRQVMERYDAQQRTKDSEVTIDMRVVSPRGEVRERVVTLWTRTGTDGTRRVLIRFLQPPDLEGTGFLHVENVDRDDDAWLYLPALRRARRIAGSDRRDAFVGTDFSYEDLDPEDLDAHRYTRVRTEDHGGRPAWVVEALPASPQATQESGYARRLLWIDQERHTLLRADLFDRDGALRKRLSADDIRRVEGSDRWRPHRLVMEDLTAGRRTELLMRQYRLDQGLGDDLFTERYLRRGG